MLLCVCGAGFKRSCNQMNVTSYLNRRFDIMTLLNRPMADFNTPHLPSLLLMLLVISLAQLPLFVCLPASSDHLSRPSIERESSGWSDLAHSSQTFPALLKSGGFQPDQATILKKGGGWGQQHSAEVQLDITPRLLSTQQKAPQIHQETTLLESNQHSFAFDQDLATIKFSYQANSTTIRLNKNNWVISQQYQLIASGIWKYPYQPRSVHCALVKQDETQRQALLSFDPSTQQLGFIELGGDYYMEPLQNVEVSADCRRVFRNGGLFYVEGTELRSIDLPEGQMVTHDDELTVFLVDQMIVEVPVHLQFHPIVLHNPGIILTYTSASLYSYKNRLVIVMQQRPATIVKAAQSSVYRILCFRLDQGQPTQLMDQVFEVEGSLVQRQGIKVSPQLSKISIVSFSSADKTCNFEVKHLDYVKAVVSDLTWRSPWSAPICELDCSTVCAFQITLGDTYFVYRTWNSLETQSFESTFEFINQLIVPYRHRALSQSELSGQWHLWIDQAIDNRLVVMSSRHSSANNQVEVMRVSYGSPAAAFRVGVAPTVAPSLDFQLPPYDSSSFNRQSMQWLFVAEGQNATQIQLHELDPGRSEGRSIRKWSVNSPYDQIVAFNSHCALLTLDDTSDDLTYELISWTQDQQLQLASLTLLTNQSFNFDQIKLAESCKRLSIGQRVYSLHSGRLKAVEVGSNNTVWASSDSELEYMYLDDSHSILKFNSIAQVYEQYLTDSELTFEAVPNIYCLSDLVVFVSFANGTCSLKVTKDSLIILKQIYTAHSEWKDKPKVAISPEQDKMILYGEGLQSEQIVGYDISGHTVSLVEFDHLNLHDGLDLVRVSSKWLYLRHRIEDYSFHLESLYVFKKDTYPVLVTEFKNELNSTDTWAGTIIRQPSSERIRGISLFEETEGGQFRVKKFEAEESLLRMSNVDMRDLVSWVQMGQVRLCEIGCAWCIEGECRDCASGYVFDPEDRVCYSCSYNCYTCSSNDTKVCTSCMNGAFLKYSKCLPCDLSCLTCHSSSTHCTECLPGYFLNQSACAACPRNCLTCDDEQTCSQCHVGFVLNENSTSCRSCALHCSSCDPFNITKCTTCATGLYMSDGACLSCPLYCQVCILDYCLQCVQGYHANTAGMCVPNCHLPCATCHDNRPQVCLSCFAGSLLILDTCVLNTSCNVWENCESCGQGLNYVLAGRLCLQCSVIPNCIQCSQANSQMCSICSKGYYPLGPGCTECAQGCHICSSLTTCHTCRPGFTFPKKMKEGACLKCLPPCSTCHEDTSYCTACQEGFHKVGWKCLNNVNVGFSFVFEAQSDSQILLIIDEIVSHILEALSQNLQRIQMISFKRIALLSIREVVTEGFAANATVTRQEDVSTSATMLSDDLRESSIGGYEVRAAHVVANGIDETHGGKDHAIIIGLSLALPASIAVVLLCVCYCYKRRKASRKSQSEEEDGQSGPEEKQHQGQSRVTELKESFSVEKGDGHSLEQSSVVLTTEVPLPIDYQPQEEITVAIEEIQQQEHSDWSVRIQDQPEKQQKIGLESKKEYRQKSVVRSGASTVRVEESSQSSDGLVPSSPPLTEKAPSSHLESRVSPHAKKETPPQFADISPPGDWGTEGDEIEEDRSSE